MHPDSRFAWTDRAELLAFVADIAFAQIFASTPAGPMIVHAPVIVTGDGHLRFHIARRNRIAAHLEGATALACVTGPNAYVSPDWYGTENQVPTWNYLAVEAEEAVRRLSGDELIAQSDALSAAHETRLLPKRPWTRAKMAPGRFEAMLPAIAGFELQTADLRGTRKLNQNKDAAARAGVIAALGDHPIAKLMGAVVTRLAVFDCDGTLVDSQANILRAMEYSFADHQLDPPCRHATRRIVGLSLREAMQVLVPEGDNDLHLSLTESFKGAFQGLRAEGMIDEPLYPGVAEGLAELVGRGWLLGVATGKSDRGLALCLAHHGIASHFVTLQTADRHPSKPHPAMLHAAMAEAGALHTAMIGDTAFDMAMAVAAGTDALGVDWGYHDAHELTEAGARHVALDFAELLERLEDR